MRNSLKGSKAKNKKTDILGQEIFDVFETIDKQKVCNYIIEQVVKKKVELFTFGKQGEIYKVALPYEGGEKYYLVAKKKKDKKDVYYDLREEFRLHSRVNDEINHPIVKPPELYGYQELPNGDQFVVMEFVPGPTLYTLIINQIIKKNNSDMLPAKNDQEADRALVKLFGIDGAKRTIMAIEKDVYLYADMPRAKMFTPQEAKYIKDNLSEFLNQMHEKHIYHRDLGANSRNIIFGTNGRICPLDFGKAVVKRDNPYEEIVDREKYVYAQDEEILKVVEKYTQK